MIDRETEVGHIKTTVHLRWQELTEGAYPTKPGEAAIAREHALRVGDVLDIGSGPDASRVTVTALVDSPSTLLSGGVYLTWPDLSPMADQMYVNSVAWVGPAAPAAPAVGLVPTVEVTDAATYVTDLQIRASNGVDVLAILLLVFATIALVVAVIVNANTFSIPFAQRRRDFALLRCVSATRHQLLRSIRAEALAPGLLATSVGLVAGALGGRGIVALIASRWPKCRLGEAYVSTASYSAALVVGLVVTVSASWLPTRAATRADPLPTLRPDAGVDLRSGAGRLRLSLGVLLALSGVALLAGAVVTQTVTIMRAGGVSTFVTVLVLGPWIVPSLLGVVGGDVSHVAGAPARLATGNARRNPKRTATTAASLLVGVTLTTVVLTRMASSRGALVTELDTQYPVDAVVISEQTLPAGILDAVQSNDQVKEMVTLDGATATLSGGEGDITVLAVGDTSVARDPARVTPADGQVLLPQGLADRARTTLQTGDRTVELDVLGGEGFGDVALVTSRW